MDGKPMMEKPGRELRLFDSNPAPAGEATRKLLPASGYGRLLPSLNYHCLGRLYCFAGLLLYIAIKATGAERNQLYWLLPPARW